MEGQSPFFIMGTWKRSFPMLVLFIGLSCCLSTSVVQSVAAASEWQLGLPDEYTMAIINTTYLARNGSMINDRAQQARKNSGRFGKGGKIGPVSGVVVHVRSIQNGTLNHFGCTPIISVVPLNESWIALVKRGLCDFDVKLKNALAKKAVGMVVYDRDESDTLEDMKLSAYAIPGVFIFKSRGERIANLTDAGLRVEMNIEVGEVCSRPYTGLNRTYNGRLYMNGDSVDGFECIDKNTSVLFVSISFIVLMVISLAWLVFYYIQRFRYLHAKDRLAQRLCNAAKKALARIPTRSVKLTDKEIIGEAECCAVCIDFYKAGDMLRTLPCRHEFHKLCVDPWLLEHRTCPMCKMDILKHYGYIFTGSQESILHLDLEDGTLNSSSDSRDTDSSTRDETQQIHTHHQHHRIHHHPTDSLSISSPTDETFSSIPDDQAEYQICDEIARKSSLISLTVTASPNGCITTAATAITTNSTPATSPNPNLSAPPSSPASTQLTPNGPIFPSCTTTSSVPSSDCLIPSLSTGGGTTTPTPMLKASIASPKDSTVITSLVSDEYHHPIIPSSQSSVSSQQKPVLITSSSLRALNNNNNNSSQSAGPNGGPPNTTDKSQQNSANEVSSPISSKDSVMPSSTPTVQSEKETEKQLVETSD